MGSVKNPNPKNYFGFKVKKSFEVNNRKFKKGQLMMFNRVKKNIIHKSILAYRLKNDKKIFIGIPNISKRSLLKHFDVLGVLEGVVTYD